VTVAPPGFKVSTEPGGGGLLAVTVTVMLWPAVSEPLDGLTLRPGGAVIVNATGPPDAVSVKVPVKGGTPFADGASVIWVVDATSLPGGGRVEVGVGVGVGVGVRVGVGFGVGVGVRVGVAEGDPAGLVPVAEGDDIAGVLEREATGDAETPGTAGCPDVADGDVVEAPCPAALPGPPPCRNIASAAAPPPTMRTSAATAA
jgi:hypothetical protein